MRTEQEIKNKIVELSEKMSEVYKEEEEIMKAAVIYDDIFCGYGYVSDLLYIIKGLEWCIGREE